MVLFGLVRIMTVMSSLILLHKVWKGEKCSTQKGLHIREICRCETVIHVREVFVLERCLY